MTASEVFEMNWGSMLPSPEPFPLLPWTESRGTDYYGAMHVAAQYCNLSNRALPYPGVWQHGCLPPWQHVAPGILVYQAPRDFAAFVGRIDAADYLKHHGYTRVRAIGLPILYTRPTGVKRIPGSVLVMPVHSIRAHASAPDLETYPAQIAEMEGDFTAVAACVSGSCIEKGWWAPQFQERGIPVIRGAAIDDRRALDRMRYLFEMFETVTTNGFGSHIFYALHFGAKVSMWGQEQPLQWENLIRDGTWAANPTALRTVLSDETTSRAEQVLGRLRVPPHQAVMDRQLGSDMIGADNVLGPRELRRCFRWDWPGRALTAASSAARQSRRLRSALTDRLQRFTGQH